MRNWQYPDVTHVDYDTNVYAAFHKALYWHFSRDAAKLDAILRQIYQGICVLKIIKI